MGIIKKIIDRELVGGTTNEEVYPISSTKAIYDTNNNTLEYILKGLLSKIEEVSARHGYYICSTISSDPDKEITIPNFELSTNVRLLVKMGYSNTVNDVSFEVNNTGAYPLYYNEAPASKNNTWASNEVLDIYFNGNSYQAFSSKEDSSSTQGYWELVNDSNGISYIKTKYPVVSEQGVTAYGGNPLIPSIFDGLPLDNTTIRKNPTTGLIEVIGGGGGTVTPGDVSWNDITNKPLWIGSTKPSYSWSEIIGEAPFYTKAEIEGKFVTVTTEQEVTGLKHFINGISIGSNKKKVYEQDGVVYIDSDVAVTGGITAFALGGREISTIMDGIAVDNITIIKEDGVLKVVGSAGSSFDEEAMWTALSSSDSSKQINISHLSDTLSDYATKSWVTSNNYAIQSWVQSQEYATQSALNSVSSKLNDFLEGSDTDTIINKWKELEAFLSGMTESDNLAEILSTKADKSFVTSELTKYVTLSTEQDITAIKHFTQGLSVGTSKHKIYEKDGAVILEGNLLVTGGVTAYSDGSSSGGSSGGIDVDLLWEILGGTGTQQINKTHLTDALSGYAVKATTLAGYGITDAYTKTESDSRFVNVSGDTMEGNLTIETSVYGGQLEIKRTSANANAAIKYSNSSEFLGYIGIGGSLDPTAPRDIFFEDINNKIYKVWHAGNDGSGSGLDADLLDGVHEASLTRFVLSPCDDGMTAESAKSYFSNSAVAGRVTTAYNVPGAEKTAIFGKSTGNYGHILMWGYDDTYLRILRLYAGTWKSSDWEKISAGNADRLTTARTIWGKSFDGTGNVSGELSQCTRIYNAANNPIYIGNSNNSNWVYTQDIASSSGDDKWAINVNGSAWFKKVNIGYTYSVEGAHLLNVEGTARANSLASTNIRIECDNNGVFGSRHNEINNYNHPLQLQFNTNQQLHLCYGGGNVGIGTTAPDQRLTVNGNTHITGNNVFDGYTIYQPNTKCLWLRNEDGWHSGIGYDSNSTECMAFGVKNTGTKFKFKVGFDWATFGHGTFTNITDAELEIGKGYVSMSCGHTSQAFKFENYNEFNCYNGDLFINERGGGNIHICRNGGNVGIGISSSSSFKLNVNGTTSSTSFSSSNIRIECENDGTPGDRSNEINNFVTHLYLQHATPNNLILCMGGGNVGIGIRTPSAKLHVVGNILATGGITCYTSDARAKTIINELDLSLKQISESPTIRFKWNGWNIKDDGKTHIGGIAQYVQKILPECILDADGTLNMDYATTAYIYSVQTARHLRKYETKTDKEIRNLKKRVLYLERKLKSLGYEESDTLAN